MPELNADQACLYCLLMRAENYDDFGFTKHSILYASKVESLCVRNVE